MANIIPKYLSDEQAERIGRAIVEEFGLKPRDRAHFANNNAWQTESGWYTFKGIARRAHRFIQEGIDNI